MKRCSGFTLMEVVVVLILLGVLAVSIIPTFSEMDDVAYEANREATLGALRTAWTVAYGDAKSAPTHTAVAALVQGTGGSACSCSDAASGQMISCGGIVKDDGSTAAKFGVAAASTCATTISRPGLITITDG